MRIDVIPAEGDPVRNTTREAAIAAGFEEGEISAGEVVSAKLRGRDAARKRIAEQAGDIPALLGTTSDAASLALLGVIALMMSLDEDTSFGEFRRRMVETLGKISGGRDLTVIAAAFMSEIEAGDVKIPVLTKGIDVVLGEIKERSTAVSDALSAGVVA